MKRALLTLTAEELRHGILALAPCLLSVSEVPRTEVGVLGTSPAVMKRQRSHEGRTRTWYPST